MRNAVANGIFFFLILSIGICACTAPQETVKKEIPAYPTETPAPTSTPEPSATPTPAYAQDWEGGWFVWVEGDIHRIPAVFTVESGQLAGTVDHENDMHTLIADFYPGGFTAQGSWSSENGASGELQLLMSDDMQEFSGNMGGDQIFCGSRTGQKKPNPCLAKIGADWSGEWIVWLGPDQFEAVLVFEADENEVSTMIYDMSGTISEDKRTITGFLNDFGVQDAPVEARILDNMAQFTGNIMGLFPFCGVRRGGPKPETCLGP